MFVANRSDVQSRPLILYMNESGWERPFELTCLRSPTIVYMRVILFDEIERIDSFRRRYSEPSYQHLNRSAQPQYADIRATLRSWFEHYPHQHQAELCTRFRSDDDGEHASAFFELFMHRFLSVLGCALEIHPAITGRLTTPDFLVTEPSSKSFYLEVRIVNDSLKDAPGEEKRRRRVMEAIDSIPLKQFSLSFQEKTTPDTDVPVRMIRAEVTRWLKTLDWRTERDRLEAGRSEYAEEHFDWKGYKVRIEAIPRPSSQRDNPDRGLVGAISGKGGFIPQLNAVRKAINDKASKYGNLQSPFLICLNVMDNSVWGDSDLIDSLLGDDQVVEVRQADGSFISEMRRMSSGSFGRQQNPQRTRVSGILAFRNLFPWSLASATVRLFHNPWATNPYDGALDALPGAKNIDGVYTLRAGLSVADILNAEPSLPTPR